MIKQTVKGAVAEYLENVAKLKASYKLEVHYFKKFEKYCLEKNINLISDVQPKHIEFLQSQLLQKQQASSVNRIFTVLIFFFKKCVEWDYLKDSPARFIKKKREAQKPRTLWNSLEIKLVAKSAEDWFKHAFLFLALTGCRPVEMASIRISDVNFDEKTVLLFSEKNATGFRLVPLSDQAFKILKAVCKNRAKNELAFVNQFGQKITTDRLNKKLKRIQKRIGITRKSIYSLRHTYATELCNRDVNLEKVRLLLGHSQIRTTQKYVKIDFLELKKIVNGG